jgi:hypothetical protein
MPKIEIKDLEKQKRQLKASFDMWEKTINETISNMKNARLEDGKKKYTKDQIDEKVELLKNGQDDIIEKWIFLGGTLEELKDGKSEKPVVKKKSASSKTITEKITDLEKEESKPTVKKVEKDEGDEVMFERRNIQTETVSKIIPKADESNPMASYDIIPLPSKGECYPSKQGRIAVSYLTAMDENIIVSPNLYRDNLVLDVILREKIRNQDINPDDLLDGDRDAIILFLRASAYGNMYSVTTTDPDTRKQFETQIDLSKLQFKEFNLVGDENGYFDYQLPISKASVKFKFLTHKDYLNLAKIDDVEIRALKKTEMDRYNERLTSYLDDDDSLTMSERKEFGNAIMKLKDWANKYDGEETQYSHRVTNEVEMQLISVNGNYDRKFIHDFVNTMPIKDLTAFRKYVAKNTPGIDYNFEIEKPESLGGGSMKVFLQFDQFIFLADTE